MCKQGLHFGSRDATTEDAGDEHFDDVLADLRQHLLVGCGLAAGLFGGDKLVVLGAHHDGVDAGGAAVVVILHGDLTFGVGAQIGHHLALAADVGQDDEDVVGQGEREGHVAVGLVVGIAEHHALVAGALFVGIDAFHAAVDVFALFVNGREDTAAVCVKLVFGLGVADAADGAAHGVLEVDVGIGLHFTRHHHLAGGDEGFASHLRGGVERQKFVEDGIGDLVCYFVRVSFRHRFGGEKISHCAVVVLKR